MYRILLPVDRSESRARTQADAVLEMPAAPGDLAVDVVHVHDEVSTPDAEWAAGGSFAETYAEEMADHVRNADRIPSAVEVAVERLESSDLEYAVHERSGGPAEAILELADELDADAIVLGVGSRSPVGKVLFGSVVQAVILDSDRPVMTVPVDVD
ncbi:universal stress protein [Natronolimnobius baerhuensis]|uniref:Universal stress protein UspA n=1 Tax=Natronolimnobius baerhuensis TaxID=253108 RepID=A0A202E8C0_9EURY|nr:universal stress protein [Natronolimnobius baerhuensis]OVE84487.1 universal stress protein UspA [Natronolimnobius baerhuensis]